MLQVRSVFCSFCFFLDQTDDTFKLSAWWEGLVLHLVYASLSRQVLNGDSLSVRMWPRGDGVRVRSGHTLAQLFAAGVGSQARLTAGKALVVLPCCCLAPRGHPLTGAGGRDVLVACAELGCSRPVLLNVGRSGGLRAPSRGQTSLLFEACCPPEEWVLPSSELHAVDPMITLLLLHCTVQQSALFPAVPEVLGNYEIILLSAKAMSILQKDAAENVEG